MSTNPDRTVSFGEEIAAFVDGAFEKRLAILVAYVNDSGFARLTFRGSTHVHADGELAFWARRPEGGVVAAIASRPELTLMYRDPEERTTVFFYGLARVIEDPALREAIYEACPEPERNADAERAGKAIVVSIERIEGRTAAGPIEITA